VRPGHRGFGHQILLLLVGYEREDACRSAVRVTHLQRGDHNLGSFGQLIEVGRVLDDHPAGAEPDAMEVEGGRVDGIGGRTVEADRRDAAPDQGAGRFRVGIAPARPVSVRAPVAGIVGIEEDDVARPDIVEARLQLAEALRASGAFEASLAQYKQAATLDPRAAEIQFGYAMALIALDRYQEARSLLAEDMSVFPDQPGFAEALARLLAAAPDDRIRDGRRALAIVQSLPRSRQPTIVLAETTAMALAELGQYAEAAKWQRDSIAAARQAGRVDLLQDMANKLSLYEHGKPCRMPWGGEIALLTL